MALKKVYILTEVLPRRILGVYPTLPDIYLDLDGKIPKPESIKQAFYKKGFWEGRTTDGRRTLLRIEKKRIVRP